MLLLNQKTKRSTTLRIKNMVRSQANQRFFCSDRERRLWAWTLAVVMAIYSTLGLARTFADALPDRELGVASFVLGMLLVLATVVTQCLNARPGGIEIGVALGITAAYFMVLVRMAIPTERSHIIEYSVVAVLIYAALTERANQGGRVPFPALLAVIVSTLIGILDECIQIILPRCVFDREDILFNFLASVMAVGGSLILGWARRMTSRRRGLSGNGSRPAELFDDV